MKKENYQNILKWAKEHKKEILIRIAGLTAAAAIAMVCLIRKAYVCGYTKGRLLNAVGLSLEVYNKNKNIKNLASFLEKDDILFANVKYESDFISKEGLQKLIVGIVEDPNMWISNTSNVWAKNKIKEVIGRTIEA